jgi:hypothetical protein
MLGFVGKSILNWLYNVIEICNCTLSTNKAFFKSLPYEYFRIYIQGDLKCK